MKTPSCLLLAALGVASVACDAPKPDEAIVEEVGLRDFGSCSELEAHIKGEALREMNAQLDQMVVGTFDDFLRSEAPAAAPAPMPTGTPAPGATDYTTTNTQERDVDEPDYVKNDGSRAFILQGRHLLKLATWPPESTRLEWALPLEGSPTEMFLDGSTVVVFSNVNMGRILQSAGIAPTTADLLPPNVHAAFRATVLDVSGAAPRVLYELNSDGRYASARRVGSTVRLVSQGGLRQPPLLYDLDRRVRGFGARREALEELRKKNTAIIQQRPLQEWLPRRVEFDGQFRPSAQECTEFHATKASVGLGLTTVSTLDLRAPTRGTTHTSILNDSDQVYASRDALYLTASHWWRPLTRMTREHTYLHKFDIASDPRRARYVASGGVPGRILDQFSMGEHQGFLRVASTRQAGGDPGRSTISLNDVYVLETRGRRLEVAGYVSGLGPGERIFSARFLGTRGYVVTFRQIDPLFTIDLSNPRGPRLVGELEIPGFSTYLHPMGDDHLLTIGRDVRDLGGGRFVQGGLSLQVFDVTDFAHPRRRHIHVEGSSSSNSEASYEHKAFNFFPSRELLAIPFSDYVPGRSGGYRSTLELYRVNLADGITPVGSVDHTDLFASGRSSQAPQVRRSIMMEDFVYSISWAGVKVNRAFNPSAIVAVVPLPPL